MSRLARWCAQRRFVVLGVWVLAAVALAVGMMTAGSAFKSSTDAPSSESSTAYGLLSELRTDANHHSGSGTAGSPDEIAGDAQFVWKSDGLAIDDPSVVEAIDAALMEIGAVSGVESVVGPYGPAAASQLNSNANIAYAAINLADDVGDTETQQISDIVTSVDADAHLSAAVWGTGFKMHAGGAPVELIGVVAALVLLLLIFRSLWAAILPIVTGVVGVGISTLIVSLASHVVTIPDSATSMGSLIGLGVGIDYAVFIVNRHRRALTRGASVHDAVAEAINTSGRAVVFAGATVVIALLGLMILGVGILSGMAIGAALTVLITVLAAITLLPALLAVLGTRALSRQERRRIATDGSIPEPTNTLFGRWADRLLRRPVYVAVAAAVVMLGLAAPALDIRLGSADASSDPTTSATRQHHDLMAEGFGDGYDAQLLLAARTPDDASRQAFTNLASHLETTDNVAAVHVTPSSADSAVSVLTVTPRTSAQSEETADLVRTMRDNLIPTAESGSDLEVYVGGQTASNVDLATTLTSKLIPYLAIIAGLGFLLLAIAFRSLLVPLIGALGNLLTMAVSLGAITAIFQWGWASSLLGVGSAAPIEPIVPVVIVGIVFGLSMDYQVFLVSRIHEEWTHTRDNTRAIRVGISETGKVIATAAMIMFLVFASFGTIGLRIISELGIGMAVAILADAFILRMGLVPALMALIGKWNWWYPGWAERITPKVSIEGGDDSTLNETMSPTLTG